MKISTILEYKIVYRMEKGVRHNNGNTHRQCCVLYVDLKGSDVYT